MLFASSFGKQPNTLSPTETMGGFCLLTGLNAAVISANHRVSVWDSPRMGDANDERGYASAMRNRSDARGRSDAGSAFVPELALNTRILDIVEVTGGFAGYELAGKYNCTGRSRSKERPRRT